MKIKSIKKIVSDSPVKFYDITVDKYHNFSIGNSNIVAHNSSLEGAVSKLARPFGNALQILEGYGFFGSEVSPDAAAARYTSVRLSSKANDILNKYKYLHVKEEDGPYEPLWMDVPIGLTTPIIGIAVGYKTSILPRKLEHIQEYLAGKRKKVMPYFEGYNGIIKPYSELGNSWILSSKLVIQKNTIIINELPPILKYATVLKKLETIMNKYDGSLKLVNNSNIKVNMELVYTGNNDEQWNDIQLLVIKAFSIIVTENPIFIKDNQVLIYDNIEQYLDDYKYQVQKLKCKNLEWDIDRLDGEELFNEAKIGFINFMLKKKRTDAEVNDFLKPYPMQISERLDRIAAKKLTSDELTSTRILLESTKRDLACQRKQYDSESRILDKMIDPTVERGISSVKSTVSLFDTDDMVEIDGVTVWTGDTNEDCDNDLE